MTPIFERLVALAVGVLLSLLLLRQMALAIRCHSSHMRNVVAVVLARILFGVLLEDLDDLAATASIHQLQEEGRIDAVESMHLSWPMDSPESSLFAHPDA